MKSIKIGLITLFVALSMVLAGCHNLTLESLNQLIDDNATDFGRELGNPGSEGQNSQIGNNDNDNGEDNTAGNINNGYNNGRRGNGNHGFENGARNNDRFGNDRNGNDRHFANGNRHNGDGNGRHGFNRPGNGNDAEDPIVDPIIEDNDGDNTGDVVNVTAYAMATIVADKNGPWNTLTITVILSDGSEIVKAFTVGTGNFGDNTFDVGSYKVYVKSQGRDKVAECYIVI